MSFMPQGRGVKTLTTEDSLFVCQVGPFPITEDSLIHQMYEDGEIPYVKRPSNDIPESVGLVRPSLCWILKCSCQELDLFASMMLN